MARGGVLASGTGRAATRGGGPVIELECTIADAAGLQQVACSCYAIVKAEFDLITGKPHHW